jgi:large subunit ribosomal protein L23
MTTATTHTPKIVLEPHQVILRPLVTEKNIHRSTHNNQYAFEISKLATKTDVKRAIEVLFNVRVDEVRTQNRKGKHRRTRFKQGTTKTWKKAVVSLKGDDRINFY